MISNGCHEGGLKTASCNKCIHKLAIGYRDAGLSIIPVRVDGSKAPSAPDLPEGVWKPYESRIATEDELNKWFNRESPAAIGMVCGAASGGIEVIDFDQPELFWPWVSLISKTTFQKLAVVETPNGWHCIYRCNEICGGRKLAMWEAPERRIMRAKHQGTRIETRGEGNYIVAEGSPVETHSTGRPYVQAFGPLLPDVQRISPEERRQLWHAAMSFDCSEDRKSGQLRKARQLIRREIHSVSYTGDEPWVWFDRVGNWSALLEPHGWTSFDGCHWTRPGKSQGTSAKVNTNELGEEILTVFSSNAGELSASTASCFAHWGKFNALVALSYGGNRSEATKYVRSMMQTNGR